MQPQPNPNMQPQPNPNMQPQPNPNMQPQPNPNMQPQPNMMNGFPGQIPPWMMASGEFELPDPKPRFGGNGFHMGPIPGTHVYDCNHILNPFQCTLANTKGRCTYLAEEQKCDTADKCNGRSRATCSQYWSTSYHFANCVWIHVPGSQPKCDSSTKCRGRSPADCVNHHFPPCMFVPSQPMMHPQFAQQMGLPPMPPMGVCRPFGSSLLAQPHQQSETAGFEISNKLIIVLFALCFILTASFTVILTSNKSSKYCECSPSLRRI